MPNAPSDDLKASDRIRVTDEQVNVVMEARRMTHVVLQEKTVASGRLRALYAAPLRQQLGVREA